MAVLSLLYFVVVLDVVVIIVVVVVVVVVVVIDASDIHSRPFRQKKFKFFGPDNFLHNRSNVSHRDVAVVAAVTAVAAVAAVAAVT